MNLRHAAAVALVGWYLMIPARGDDASAPPSTWTAYSQTFKSQKECKMTLLQLRQMMREPGAEKTYVKMALLTKTLKISYTQWISRRNVSLPTILD